MNKLAIPAKVIPKDRKYAWLDLEIREWQDVEFLPNGWERVPFERHKDLFIRNPCHGFIEVDGLTLCEQTTENEQSKQGLDWETAIQVGNEAEDEYDMHQLEIALGLRD